MLQKLKYSLFIFFAISYGVFTYAQEEDVLFQAFDWNVHMQANGKSWYQIVSENRTRIKDVGIDLIWMPPPSKSAAPQGYLPSELNNFNSAYGTENELRALIQQYHNLNIKVISDVVINHRVGTLDAVNFTNPYWPTYFIVRDDEGNNFVNPPVEFSINSDFYPGNSLKSDGSNGGFGAARDLDHQNPAVRSAIITWMNKLKALGFDGWRYDFVHGYDPYFNKIYNDATNPYFSVGELLESSRIQTNNFVNRTQGSSSAFDFNTKVSLQNAFRDNNLSYLRDFSNKPSGMIGVNPSKSVTFLDNHDTGLAQQCCGAGFVFPSDETSLRKGYAYILSHPGNPMIFWTHLFDSGTKVAQAIKDMIAIRKEVGIYAGSSISIPEARWNLYAAYIDGKNGTIAMKLGNGDWSPYGSGWVLKTSGTDYAIWAKTDGITEEETPPFTINFIKPDNWKNKVFVYFFDAATNTTLRGTPQWPGYSMDNGSRCRKKFTYKLNPKPGIKAENIRVIFTDEVYQSNTSSRSTDGCYSQGRWVDRCSGICDDLANNSIRIRFLKPNNWGDTANMYVYDVETNRALQTAAPWPGKTMYPINSGWYQQEIQLLNSFAYSQIGIVFNNGNGAQTVDLRRDTSGWFRVTGANQGKLTGSWSTNCTISCPDRRGEITNYFESFSASTQEQSEGAILLTNPITKTQKLSVTAAQSGELEVFRIDFLGKNSSVFRDKIPAGTATIIPIANPSDSGSGIFFYKLTLDGKEFGKPMRVIHY